MTRQFISGDEAPQSNIQHSNPCTDCPFARTALAGWLGGSSPEEWMRAVHGETRIDCHAISGPQCAGAAIYRSNVCKQTRDKTQLRLLANPTKVFSSAAEFITHHMSKPRLRK